MKPKSGSVLEQLSKILTESELADFFKQSFTGTDPQAEMLKAAEAIAANRSPAK